MPAEPPRDPVPDRSVAALEIRGTGGTLLDDPFLVVPRGAPPGETLIWRGRLRDDDGRVWRANAATAAGLGAMWAPSKGSAGPIPALLSLRPVAVDVRLELPDRRSATREIVRLLVGDGVRVRRWREGVTGTLLRPAEASPAATVVLDARGGPAAEAVATLAGALLASRGVLLLTVLSGRGTPGGDEALAVAAAQLARVPGAGEARTLTVRTPDRPSPSPDEPVAVVLPAGIAGGDPADAVARAAAWDALLAQLGARPRATG